MRTEAAIDHAGGSERGSGSERGGAGAHELDLRAFTTDELDVIELIGNGYTDRAIARRLSVSVVTVRRRATSFRAKVGARNRSEAVAIAVGMGWFEHPAVRGRADDK